MPITDPQPGSILRAAEVVLLLNMLRANLAIAEHLLGGHTDPEFAAAIADLRTSITRLEGASKGKG